MKVRWSALLRNSSQQLRIRSPGKQFCSNVGSLSFLKSVTKFFDNDLCLSKIKIDDKLKTIAFDEKNKRLAIMSYDRIMYYLDVPEQ